MSSKARHLTESDWLSIVSLLTLSGAAIGCLMIMWFTIPHLAFLALALLFAGVIGFFGVIWLGEPPTTHPH